MGKKIAAATVLMLFVLASVSAQGAAETYQMQETVPSQDGTVVLQGRDYTGTLALEDDRVVLQSGDDRYVLHVHPMYTAGIDVEPDERVSLYGYELPSGMFDDGRTHIMVSRATIAGETIVMGLAAEQGRLVVPEDQLFRMVPASRMFVQERSGWFFGRGVHRLSAPAHCYDQQFGQNRRGYADTQDSFQQPQSRMSFPRGRQGR